MSKRVILFLLSLIVSNFLHAQNHDDELNYALIATAAKGNTDSLIEILKQHPDINFRDANNGTALFYATQRQRAQICQNI